MNESAQDVFNYLNKLRESKKSLGAYHVSKEEGLFIIYDQNNIPRHTMTEKIFRIFEEMEV